MENTEIVKQGIDIYKEQLSLSEILAKSGMFSDVKSQYQAFVKILAGKELGFSAIDSMTNIFFVKDRRGLTSSALAMLIKKSGKYDYAIKKLDEKECIISFYKITEKENILLGESIFTTADAAKAGLINKDNWKNYPRNCLFARALANGIRWFTPDVVCGYAIEEFEELPAEEIKKDVIEITKEGEVK